MNDDNLPPLPAPSKVTVFGRMFTEDQMRAYARTAIAAQPAEPVATVMRRLKPDGTTHVVITPHAGVDLEALVHLQLCTAPQPPQPPQPLKHNR